MTNLVLASGQITNQGRDHDCPGRACGRHVAARARALARYAPQHPPPPITRL